MIIVSLAQISCKCHLSELFQSHLTIGLWIRPLFLVHVVFGDYAFGVEPVSDGKLGLFDALWIHLYLLIARKFVLVGGL